MSIKKSNNLTSSNNFSLTSPHQIRSLTILLVLHGVVSFRSIPRILEIFNLNFLFKITWIPHFTSVINWNNLLGLGMLKQVQTISEPWIAIMDHSIDIGIKKVLVVLRVRMDLFNHKEGATTLKDCECIGIKISTKVNGETIAKDLEEIFLISGVPTAIIKDRDYTLNKGVKIFMDKLNIKIPIIDDITHEVANALKKQFENTKSYKIFMKLH